MVPIDRQNVFELREYAVTKILKGIGSDPFKSCFVRSLDLFDVPANHFEFSELSLYQKCTVSGLNIVDETASESDLARLLGQNSRIDSTPMPWVSDWIGVMAIKWLAEKQSDHKMREQFQSWISRFVPQQIQSDRLNDFESDIAQYVQDSSSAEFSTATIPLFLHYRGIGHLSEQTVRQDLLAKFDAEFRQQVVSNNSHLILAIMLYCFDHANKDLARVPPNGWSLNDLSLFLDRIPIGLRRWTWENEKGRTRNSGPVKWLIENEYHVQNLLYVLLAPIFDDIADEITLPQVGQKNPRADLYLPNMHTIIEVKYRKDTKKSFAKLIGEIAEDASLYHADAKYKNAYFVCFLWDDTCSTQEHAKFREGVLKIQGVNKCITVCSPSFM